VVQLRLMVSDWRGPKEEEEHAAQCKCDSERSGMERKEHATSGLKAKMSGRMQTCKAIDDERVLAMLVGESNHMDHHLW